MLMAVVHVFSFWRIFVYVVCVSAGWILFSFCMVRMAISVAFVSAVQ